MEKNTVLLELIHSDFCDSQRVLSHSGSQYFITFIDDLSKYYCTYLTSSKSDLFDKFKMYKAEVESVRK